MVVFCGTFFGSDDATGITEYWPLYAFLLCQEKRKKERLSLRSGQPADAKVRQEAHAAKSRTHSHDKPQAGLGARLMHLWGFRE